MSQIFLFPGLGADHRMYDPLRHALPGLVTPDWDSFQPEGTIADFAHQILLAMPELRNATVIGGSSFGGFVAWEVAAVVRPKTLVLLGSASSPDAVRAYLRALLPFGRSLPQSAFSAMSHFGISGAPFFGAWNMAAAKLFASMARRASPSLLAWAMQSISSWTPSGLSPLTEVQRLHGSRDLLIRPPLQKDCYLIEKAGHLPTLTHPNEVCQFLSTIMTEPAWPDEQDSANRRRKAPNN